MADPVLYYCPQTRAETALWMNEELGGPCTIEIIDLKAGAQKAPAFLALNPMGKLPALDHDNHVVSETGALCTYLADHYNTAGLAPAIDDPRRGPYLRWIFFASGCLEPAMMDKLSGTERENTASAGHGSFADVLTSLKVALALYDGPYILGEIFSAADVVLGSTINFATMFGAIDREEPFTTYLATLLARPAYQRAQEKSTHMAKELGYT